LRSVGILLTGSASLPNKKPPRAPVSLNIATSAQLQQVPGIGPSAADKIVQMGKSCGPCKSVNNLRAVRGIGPKKLEKMRKYLVAGKSAPKKPATSTVTSSPSTGSTAKQPWPTTPTKTSTAKALPAPAVPIAKVKPEVSDEEPQ
jgi:competence ComEA-like helix-hairpin-helix protein